MRKDQAKILALSVYTALKDKDKQQAEKIVANFLAYLKDHRLNSLIPKVLGELEQLYLQEQGIIKATIQTKNKLSDKEVKQIKDLITERSQKKVELRQTTLDEMIGGAIIKYEDKVIDLSLKRQLNNLAKQLAS